MGFMQRITVFLVGLGVLMVYACRLAGQEVPPRLRTGYGALDERLSRMVTADSSAINPEEAAAIEGAIYLDAREAEEYAVSHLPGAVHLGFDRPDYSVVEPLDRDTPLIVYCTIGYRSERTAEDLRSRGFNRVYNLYGSIYAWILDGRPLTDAEGVTHRVHTYNRKWGDYLPDGIVTKIED